MKLTTIFDEKVEEVFLVVSMAIIVLLIFSQAFFRYFAGSGLTWGEELARYVHIWQVWIGASLVVRKGGHVRITVVRDLFSPTVKKYLDLLATLSWFLLAVFLAYEGTIFVNHLFETGQKTPSMGILTGIPYIAIPLGGLLMAIRLIQQIIFIFRGVDEDSEVVRE